jgi:hypothetical protein
VPDNGARYSVLPPRRGGETLRRSARSLPNRRARERRGAGAPNPALPHVGLHRRPHRRRAGDPVRLGMPVDRDGRLCADAERVRAVRRRDLFRARLRRHHPGRRPGDPPAVPVRRRGVADPDPAATQRRRHGGGRLAGRRHVRSGRRLCARLRALGIAVNVLRLLVVGMLVLRQRFGPHRATAAGVDAGLASR